MPTLKEVFEKEIKLLYKDQKTFRDKTEYYRRYSEWLEVVVKQLKLVVEEIPKKYIQKPWKPFYFEGNLAWGWMDTPMKWERIKKCYEDSTVDLKAARRKPNVDRDAFGFYFEYTGEERLGDFAKKHNMDLNVHEEQCMIDINGICSCEASLK